MQRFLSTLGSILQTLHWTKSKNVANYMSQAGAEASQVKGESQVIKAEADPAYVNLKVKQQVALCRGSISISIDTVFRMAQLPISELSAAHNSKRYSACSFCQPSFFVTRDLLSRPSYAAHRFFLSASVHRPPRSQVAYFAITPFSTYPQRPYRTSRML